MHRVPALDLLSSSQALALVVDQTKDGAGSETAPGTGDSPGCCGASPSGSPPLCATPTRNESSATFSPT